MAAPASYSLPSQYEVIGNGTYDPCQYNNDSDVMPVTGAKNGLVLYDLRGSDYDDPKWETLLDQLSVDDMVQLIGYGGYGSPSMNMHRTTWAGANPDLLNIVLRDEWGFRGMVLTDYFGNYGYMDADKAVRGGSDIMLATAGNDAIMTDTTSATSVLAMRQACKNIMYTMVNSYTYETYDSNAISGWVRTFCIVDAVGVALLLAAEVALIVSYRKKKSA